VVSGIPYGSKCFNAGASSRENLAAAREYVDGLRALWGDFDGERGSVPAGVDVLWRIGAGADWRAELQRVPAELPAVAE
jgi:hypothetical protein